MTGSRLINRNVNATCGRTSMRLEPEVWDALREICLREGVDLGELIHRIERAGDVGGRTSAVRVHVLQYFRAAATEEGHLEAGHGQAQDGGIAFAGLDGHLKENVGAAKPGRVSV